MGSNTTTGTPDPAAPLLGWVAAAIVAMAATLAAWYLPLPWRLAGAPFALGGTLIGIITSVKAFRNPASGGLRLGAPIATLACGLLALPLIGQLVFYAPALQYQECRRDALTLRSADACTRDLTQHITNSELRSKP